MNEVANGVALVVRPRRIRLFAGALAVLFVAAFVVNLPISSEWWAALGTAAGNTLAQLVAGRDEGCALHVEPQARPVRVDLHRPEHTTR